MTTNHKNRNSKNKMMAAGMLALAMTMTGTPFVSHAAGLRSIQAKENISYIALKGSNQEAILKRLKLLGLNSDCMELLENILNQNCPTVPAEPETEAPTVPAEPETEAPTVPVEPETEAPTVPAEPETETTPSVPSKPENSFAAQVIELVNAERAKEGLKPLVYDETIEQAALVRTKEIQTSFSHTRPNGTSFSTALKEAGINYRRSGENIAWGQKTPEAVVKAWMNSPSHRANIMNANYGKIGVGYLTNEKGTPYWVQLFTN